MAIISLVLSLIILTILYRRMIGREEPDQIGKAQAAVPVGIGILSTPGSFVLYMGIAYSLVKLGVNTTSLPTAIRSIISAFLQAGLPEELVKMILMLLAIRLFRSKIRNVYEYIMIGAAIGFGFTLLEEFLYGSSGIIDIAGRFITLAGHMAFGMIMAKHLGYARYNKMTGSGKVGSEKAKAFLIPAAVHTLYDAFTADNKMLASTSDTVVAIGAVCGVLAIIMLFIVQYKVLTEFKKNARKYCDMKFITE